MGIEVGILASYSHTDLDINEFTRKVDQSETQSWNHLLAMQGFYHSANTVHTSFGMLFSI